MIQNRNTIPEQIFNAIESLGFSKIMKGKAFKLVCLIMQKSMYNNNDFSSYVELPAHYLEKIFNKEYHTDFFNKMKTSEIIVCNDIYRKGTKKKRGQSKSYKLNPDLIDDVHVPVFYDDKKNGYNNEKDGNCKEKSGDYSEKDGYNENAMISIRREYFYQNSIQTESDTPVSLISESSKPLISSNSISSYHISSRLFEKSLLTDDLSSLVYSRSKMKAANEEYILSISTRLFVDEKIQRNYFEVRNNIYNSSYEISRKSALIWAKDNGVNLIQDGSHFYFDNIADFIKKKVKNIRFSFEWFISKVENEIFYAGRNMVNRRLDHNLTCAGKHLIEVIKEDNDLIEIDIKNSQFVIHAWWMKQQGLLIHDDVRKYYEMCKGGMLYDSLAVSLSTVRKVAKELMMEIGFSSEGNNTPVKAAFRKKFPNVVAHIDRFKKESKDYKLFSNELQQMEAEIVIDNLYPNIKELGVFCLTKHDSIIIKRKDRAIVMKVITSFFNELRFECALNVDDDQVLIENKTQSQELNTDDIAEIATGGVLDTQILDQIKNVVHYKAEPVLTEEEHRFEAFDEFGMSTKQQSMQANKPKEEMKKKYTVDELLRPKEAVIQPAPTKLQHLKIGEGAAKMNDINRIVKGIQEQDKEDEKGTSSMSSKEIAVEVLKTEGYKINKENVDYLTKLLKEEFNKKDSSKNEPERPAYKYVNPYVRKSA